MQHELTKFGWAWTDQGPIVTVGLDGLDYQVLVPLRNVWVTFGEHLDSVGCPMQSVGSPFTVGGLFGSITRSIKRFGRKASRALKKAAKAVAHTAQKGFRSAVKLGDKYGKFVMPTVWAANKVARNKQFRTALNAASNVIPVLQPMNKVVQAGNFAYDTMNRGFNRNTLAQLAGMVPGGGAMPGLPNIPEGFAAAAQRVVNPAALYARNDALHRLPAHLIPRTPRMPAGLSLALAQNPNLFGAH